MREYRRTVRPVGGGEGGIVNESRYRIITYCRYLYRININRREYLIFRRRSTTPSFLKTVPNVRERYGRQKWLRSENDQSRKSEQPGRLVRNARYNNNNRHDFRFDIIDDKLRPRLQLPRTFQNASNRIQLVRFSRPSRPDSEINNCVQW